MIVAATPFATDRNLGAAYNEFLGRLSDDDWAVLIDHDAMWTTPHWYNQLSSVLVDRSIGCITAMTNRIGCPYQRVPGADANHDVRFHRQLGEQLRRQHGTDTIDVTRREPLISGVVLTVRAGTVRAVGGFRSGLLGVDNALHASLRDAGFQVLLMPGLYVYHWYRADGRVYVK